MKNFLKVFVLIFIIIFSLSNVSCSSDNIKEDIIKYDSQYKAISLWNELNSLQEIVKNNQKSENFDIYQLELVLIKQVEIRNKIIESLKTIKAPEILEEFHENKLNQLIYRNQADTLLLEDFRDNFLTNSYNAEESENAFEKIKVLMDQSESYSIKADKLREQLSIKYHLTEILPSY